MSSGAEGKGRRRQTWAGPRNVDACRASVTFFFDYTNFYFQILHSLSVRHHRSTRPSRWRRRGYGARNADASRPPGIFFSSFYFLYVVPAFVKLCLQIKTMATITSHMAMPARRQPSPSIGGVFQKITNFMYLFSFKKLQDGVNPLPEDFYLFIYHWPTWREGVLFLKLPGVDLAN